MRRLATWSFGRVLGTALLWVVVALVLAFLTPPGQFLIELYRTMQTQATVNMETPVRALRIWFAVVPLVAFGPPAALLIGWLRGRGVRSMG